MVALNISSTAVMCNEIGFECVNCSKDSIDNEFYNRISSAYKKICGIIMEYYQNTYDVIFPQSNYAFLACKEGNLYGACGIEDDNKVIKYYINPYIFTPDTPVLQIVSRIFRISIHEVTHGFLYLIDKNLYDLRKNIHPEEFIILIDEVSDFFYDIQELLKSVW